MQAMPRAEDGARPLVLHNIGRGPQAEDVLFAYTRGYVARWEIIGHFRFGFAEPKL